MVVDLSRANRVRLNTTTKCTRPLFNRQYAEQVWSWLRSVPLELLSVVVVLPVVLIGKVEIFEGCRASG